MPTLEHDLQEPRSGLDLPGRPLGLTQTRRSPALRVSGGGASRSTAPWVPPSTSHLVAPQPGQRP